MEKSIFSEAHAVVLKALREGREAAGLTQEQLAVRLDTTQSVVSKIERGERRIDLVELAQIAAAIDVDLGKFVEAVRSDPAFRKVSVAGRLRR